ncbi:hypothetical protein [Mycobacterium lepromatosis]|uniref:hypothetical protein n=1 Tax=Mycobacterium lepromatosis TaxID=480418 RepID=UPI0012E0C251|nr:hypothetical protein [Mycobacterium lepromatosis]
MRESVAVEGQMLGHLCDGCLGNSGGSCNTSSGVIPVAVLLGDLFGCTVAIASGHHSVNQGVPFKLIGTITGALADV